MTRLTVRDGLAIAVLFVAGAAVVALALTDRMDWALAALGVLGFLIGALSRLQFVTRRSGLNAQRDADRTSRRLAEDTASAVRMAVTAISDTQQRVVEAKGEVEAMRAELSESDALTLRRLTRKLDAANSELAELRGAVAAVARQGRRQGPELLTDFQALSQLLTRYAPTAALPLVSGWALSPAGLLFLADSIEQRDAQFVVECGSGTSTLWMAMAMRRKGTGKVLALEHDEEYAARTRTVLEAHGVSAWAEVRVSPLVSVATPRGQFRWYDVDAEAMPEEIDILLVDGPPGTTGRHARYPALPLLAAKLAADCLIVVDDAERPDEREAAAFWQEEMPAMTELPSPGRGVLVLSLGSSGLDA